jgi:lipopolysaccharide biosynthesis glycosyltransferase
LNIAIAFSPNWAYYAWIEMYSLFKNNKAPIKVYLLSDNLLDEEIEEFDKMCRHFGKGYTVEYINALEKYNKLIPSGINVDNRFSKYTLYRLLLPYFVKEDRLLYLDADAVINGDLSEFYNIDLEDNLIAGIEDTGLSKYYKRADYMKSLGLTNNDAYINAGIALMNMKAIKEINLADKWVQMANDRLYPNHDQDIFNITCSGRIKLVDFKYNVSLSTGLNIKEEDIKIMHYAGQKPWANQNVPFYSLWRKWQKKCDLAFSDRVVKEYISRKIIYCWFGFGEKSEEIKKCIQSWKIHCPDYEIIEWNEKNCDVNCNKFVQGAYKAKKYAYVADYFRMKAMYEEGCVTLDTDVELLKNLDAFLIYRGFTGQEINGKILVCATMAFEKGHPLIKTILDYYENITFDINNIKPNTEFITKIFQLFIKEKCKNGKIILSGDVHLFPQVVFCPYDHKSLKTLPNKELTHSLHHFHASWKK